MRLAARVNFGGRVPQMMSSLSLERLRYAAHTAKPPGNRKTDGFAPSPQTMCFCKGDHRRGCQTRSGKQWETPRSDQRNIRLRALDFSPFLAATEDDKWRAARSNPTSGNLTKFARHQSKSPAD